MCWRKQKNKQPKSVEADVVTNFIKDEFKIGKNKLLKFDVVEIEKKEFHCSKSAIANGNVNIDKIVISKKFPCTKKVNKNSMTLIPCLFWLRM